MAPADLAGLATLFELLSETTLAGSAAVLLVLALRRRLRQAFGATVAYAAWALVPAAVVAVSLPAATVTVAAAPVAMLVTAAAAPLAAVPVAAPFDAVPWLLAAWLAGVAVMVLRLGRQQRAFRRGLGRLRLRADGLQQAESVAGLPAAIGLLRPAIVVPADFDSRYSGEERALMHAHERCHIVRGDLQINALLAGLRSVFWFNPLLHYATGHFRHDQELACDQHVIARHPRGRRAYGEAMFKTQLASQPLPLGCHWAAFHKVPSHPLKERIAMLKQPTPTAARWIGGGALVVVLALGVGFAAWSAQPKREVVAAGLLPAAASETGQQDAARGAVEAIALETVATAAAPRVPSVPPVPPAPPAAMAPSAPPALPAPPRPPARMKAGTTANNAQAPLPPLPALPPLKSMVAPLPPLPASPTPEAGIAPAAPQAIVAPHVRQVHQRAAVVNRTPAPRYPAGIAAQGIGGNVVLLIDIDAQGKPVNVEVERSEPAGLFDQATVDAVRQWQFVPEIEDGKAVAGRVRVPIKFAPKKPEAVPAL